MVGGVIVGYLFSGNWKNEMMFLIIISIERMMVKIGLLMKKCGNVIVWFLWFLIG